MGEGSGRENARIGALRKKGRSENGSGEARGGFTSSEKAGSGDKICAEFGVLAGGFARQQYRVMPDTKVLKRMFAGERDLRWDPSYGVYGDARGRGGGEWWFINARDVEEAELGGGDGHSGKDCEAGDDVGLTLEAEEGSSNGDEIISEADFRGGVL